jgi:CubicO group peptidase (beta-lactamase class C family)
MKDASGITVGGYGLSLTMRDLIKIGQLYLDGGVWEGQTIIPSTWIETSLVARAETHWTRGSLGYLWWIWKDKGFRAGGRFGQQLAVFPSQRMIVAYTANLPLETADAILDGITKDYILGATGTLAAPAPSCVLSQRLDEAGAGP